jgi:hypothetical protein
MQLKPFRQLLPAIALSWEVTQAVQIFQPHLHGVDKGDKGTEGSLFEDGRGDEGQILCFGWFRSIPLEKGIFFPFYNFSTGRIWRFHGAMILQPLLIVQQVRKYAD